MNIVSAFAMFAVIWFMVFLVGLPLGRRTQADEGEIVPGTHAGAPTNFRFKPLALWVTLITFVLWGLMTAVVYSGWITVRDLDLFGVMDHRAGAAAATDDTGE